MKKTSTLLGIIFLFHATPSQAQVDLQFGLVAAYPMNNSPLDSTSNHLDLTMYGSPIGTMDRFGVLGGAYSLDAGNPDYFTTTISALNAPAQLTLSAWVNLTNSMNDQKIAGRAVVGGGYLMGVDSNKIDAEIWDSYANHFRLKAGNIAPNTWTHLAISFQSNSYLKVYINGLAVDSIPSNVFPVGTSGIWPFTVGGAPWQPTALNATGGIDDIYLYERVINAAEMDALYNLIATSIDGTPAFKISSLYPVPVLNGYLTIEFNNHVSGKVLVNLTDALGRIVYSSEFVNPEKELIDLSRLKCGMYSISLSNDGRTETHQLLIQ